MRFGHASARTLPALLLLAALPATVPQAAAAQGRPVAKVAVTEAGEVTLDGHPVTLPELREALRSLADWKGEVWYYRPNPAGEPPPNALAVIQAIADARLPVRFATKPDFSAFDAPPDPAPGP